MNKDNHPKSPMRLDRKERDKANGPSPGFADPLVDLVRVMYGRKGVATRSPGAISDAQDLTPSSKSLPGPSPNVEELTANAIEIPKPSLPGAENDAAAPAWTQPSSLAIGVRPAPVLRTTARTDVSTKNQQGSLAVSSPAQQRPDQTICERADIEILSSEAGSNAGEAFRDRITQAALAGAQVTPAEQSKEHNVNSLPDASRSETVELGSDTVAAPLGVKPGRSGQNKSPVGQKGRSAKSEPKEQRPDTSNESSQPVSAVAAVKSINKSKSKSARWESPIDPEVGLAALPPRRFGRRSLRAAGLMAVAFIVGTATIVYRSGQISDLPPAFASARITSVEIEPEDSHTQRPTVESADRAGIQSSEWSLPKDESRLEVDRTSTSRAPAGLIGPKDVHAVLIRPDGTVVFNDADIAVEIQAAPAVQSPQEETTVPTGSAEPIQTLGAPALATSAEEAQKVAGTPGRIGQSEGLTLTDAEDVAETLVAPLLQPRTEAENLLQAKEALSSVATSVADRNDTETSGRSVPQLRASAPTAAALSHEISEIFATEESFIPTATDDWAIVFSSPESTTISTSVGGPDPIPVPRPQ